MESDSKLKGSSFKISEDYNSEDLVYNFINVNILEGVLKEGSEVVPEINSLEDLNKWLSDSGNISKKLILDKDNDKR